MDTKALAKSKRAHTLQHSKKKPSNVQKQGTGTSSGGSNAGAKPILNKHDKERARQAKLPSNWDRYDEEDVELDSVGNSNLSDVVVRKSKGADYRYLITEAQSQSQSQRLSSKSLNFDCFPSLHDDVLDVDFNQGLASILSVRGEGIRSWVSDDNFVVEDEKSSTLEASFFSLNLLTLAEQLEKVDLSERLFIEPDLLGSVLPDQGSAAYQDSHQIETFEDNATTTVPKASTSKASTQSSTAKNQSPEVIVSDSATNARSASVSPNERIDILNQKRSDIIHGGKSGQEGELHPQKQFYGSSIANNGKKKSAFEATVAETELDKLLDSFNDSTSLASTSPVSAKASSSYHSTNSSVSKHVTSDVDDILNDLLSQPLDAKPTPKESQASSQSVTKTSNVDDILDDLLNQPLQAKPIPKETQTSSQFATKSKLLDDFDSWLDSI